MHKKSEKILVSKKEMLKEHKRIIPLIKRVSPAEAKKQTKEMKKYK